MEKKRNDGENERRSGIKWQRNRGRKEIFLVGGDLLGKGKVFAVVNGYLWES